MSDCEIITIDGVPRKLACLPREISKPGDGLFRVFGETDGTPPLMTWDQINASKVDLSGFFAWHTIDQGRQGSCSGSAGAHEVMGLREMAGLDRIVISQASLYGPGNGGTDSGMAIDVCLRVLTRQGAMPASIIDPMDWRGYWRKSWPDGWRKEARSYMALEAWDCPDLQHALSAVNQGWPVQYGAKGHAVIRVANDKDKNSWGADWGKYGNGIGVWTTRKEMEVGIRQYGAWALRVVTDPIGDGDVPISQS